VTVNLSDSFQMLSKTSLVIVDQKKDASLYNKCNYKN